MDYGLPESVHIDGLSEPVPIRADYRAVLDVCAALSDPSLNREEKTLAALGIFYPGIDDIPAALWGEALRACFEFINLGEPEQVRSGPKLMDWEQDFNYIIAPVNRVAGREIRAVPYDDGRVTEAAGLHWYTFVGYYREIGGECTFALIVRLRDKLRRHKKLDAAEKEFYRSNRELVDFRNIYSEDEEAFIRSLTGKGG